MAALKRRAFLKILGVGIGMSFVGKTSEFVNILDDVSRSNRIKFRRYEAFPLCTRPLAEGVSPSNGYLKITWVEK